jgi:hypothetical protein
MTRRRALKIKAGVIVTSLQLIPVEKVCNFLTLLRVVKPNSYNFLSSIAVHYIRSLELVLKISQEIFN